MFEKILNIGLHTKKLFIKTGTLVREQPVFLSKINKDSSVQFIDALKTIDEANFAHHPVLVRTEGETVFMHSFTHNPPNGQDALPLEIPDIMGQDRAQYLLERGIAAPAEAIEFVSDQAQVQRNMYLEDKWDRLQPFCEKKAQCLCEFCLGNTDKIGECAHYAHLLFS